MFDNLKRSIKNIQKINPKALLVSFAQSQKVKRKDYTELLASNTELKSLADERRLEAMVSKQIKIDFPEISENTLELLTDATMHLIRKKQLQAMDDYCFK